MKIAINVCYGGFGLSDVAMDKIRALHEVPEIHEDDLLRHDPILISVLEEMGEAAQEDCCRLHLVDWPDAVPYSIREYDGAESITVNWVEFMESLHLRFGESIPYREIQSAIDVRNHVSSTPLASAPLASAPATDDRSPS